MSFRLLEYLPVYGLLLASAVAPPVAQGRGPLAARNMACKVHRPVRHVFLEQTRPRAMVFHESRDTKTRFTAFQKRPLS